MPGLGALVFGTLLGGAAALERTVQYTLLPDARSVDATEWRYATTNPGDGWNAAVFDDAAWGSGKAGFGTGASQGGAVIATDWPTPDIWIRKTFTIASLDFESLILEIQHDEDVEVYLNGTPVLNESFITGTHQEIFLPDAAKAALKAGSNVIAVHCRNTDGPGYIDVGLDANRTMEATVLINDADNGGDTWKWTDVSPGGSFNQADFADADWQTGHSGFGSNDLYAAHVGTNWLNYEIWLRRKFTVAKVSAEYLLTYLHDDAMEIYLNEKLLLQETGSGPVYKSKTFASADINVAAGENIVAVHCTNSGGGAQFIDAGLIGLDAPAPVAARRAKSAQAGSHAAFPSVLYAGRDRTLNLAGFPSSLGATLEVFGLDGRLRASLRPLAGTILALPSALATGTYRYLWRSPAGTGQGKLIRLP